MSLAFVCIPGALSTDKRAFFLSLSPRDTKQFIQLFIFSFILGRPWHPGDRCAKHHSLVPTTLTCSKSRQSVRNILPLYRRTGLTHNTRKCFDFYWRPIHTKPCIRAPDPLQLPRFHAILFKCLAFPRQLRHQNQ